MTTLWTPAPLHVSAIRATMDGQKWLRIISEADGFERAYVPFGDRTPEEYRQCMSDAKLYAKSPEMARLLQNITETDAVHFYDLGLKEDICALLNSIPGGAA